MLQKGVFTRKLPIVSNGHGRANSGQGHLFKRRAGHIFERRHPSLTGLLRRRSRLLCSPERVRKRVVGHLFYRRKFANSRAAQEVILIRYDLKACCTSTQRCGPHLRASYVENAGVEGRIGLCTHTALRSGLVWHPAGRKVGARVKRRPT